MVVNKVRNTTTYDVLSIYDPFKLFVSLLFCSKRNKYSIKKITNFCLQIILVQLLYTFQNGEDDISSITIVPKSFNEIIKIKKCNKKEVEKNLLFHLRRFALFLSLYDDVEFVDNTNESQMEILWKTLFGTDDTTTMHAAILESLNKKEMMSKSIITIDQHILRFIQLPKYYDETTFMGNERSLLSN